MDYNGQSQFGINSMQFTIKNNIRHSTDRAFLQPIRRRPNINVSVNSFVTQILIDSVSKSATGVRFVKDQQTYVAYATKEVILSAGSINTPQILMWSGVGPERHLKENKIDVVQNLPVGENLDDHVFFVIPFR